MKTTAADINQAVKTLHDGGVIAYPTEAVYGLGCDPFNPSAATKILQLKGRSIKKGFILVASRWEQLEPLVNPIEPRMLFRIFETWPGPNTWLFPAKPDVPEWIHGGTENIAIRVSAHPTVKDLCDHFGGPIVSTSANRSGQASARSYHTAKIIFEADVDFILPGKVGGEKNPTEIRSAITGEVIRPA